MKKVFDFNYEGHRIQVVNSWFFGEKLYVDGKLQDENLGVAIRATLEGVLRSNDNLTKNIKVTLGGIFTVNCKVFVDNTLVFSNR
ncbi:hypothetical protein [Bacillus infantis]|uniref:hypothetical protein n=1 Tax=Bacillus infantis TaxID=324767 RepID=UPI003CF8518E